MNKDNVIREVACLIRSGCLTKNELLEVYRESVSPDDQETLSKQSRISNILYYIGGAIVFLGICIFVGTNWASLNDVTKIMATLGSSVMIYVAAVLLSRYDHLEKVSDAFYFISALIAPLGIFITADIAGIDTSTAGSHSMVAAIVLTVQMLSFCFDRRNVFVIFGVIFGTWLFFGLTTFLIGGRPFTNWDFVKYRWLIAGLSHMVLGYALADTSRKGLTPYLYGFGSWEFLNAGLLLGGWSPNQNVFWELAFPGLAFGIMFLSVYAKVRSFLVFGTIYLMFYILKITHEYFTSGFGWALSLVVIGFTLMGIGYFAYSLNKKYLQPHGGTQRMSV